jgi:hypothetical protein
MKINTGKKEFWIKIKVGENECEFLVSPLAAKESFALVDKASPAQWEKGQRFKDPNFYQMKINRIDKVIRDWRGIEDEDGNPIACTKESKILVYEYNSPLIDEALDQADKMSNIFEKEKEEELKNSKAGSSGAVSPA